MQLVSSLESLRLVDAMCRCRVTRQLHVLQVYVSLLLHIKRRVVNEGLLHPVHGVFYFLGARGHSDRQVSREVAGVFATRAEDTGVNFLDLRAVPVEGVMGAGGLEDPRCN